MKIYIVRHGETDANKNSVLQGSSNWPLNDDGIRLAKITGEKMKGIKFDVCFSSPLDRSIQTAKLILQASNNKAPIITDDRLKEINMGEWEGKSFNPKKLEVNIIKILLFQKNAFWIGRFKGGETAKEVCIRTQDFLTELSSKNYENVLVSTHGCATRAMLNMLYENKKDFWQGHVPYNCSVNIVEVKNKNMELIEKDKIYYDEKDIVDRFKFK